MTISVCLESNQARGPQAAIGFKPVDHALDRKAGHLRRVHAQHGDAPDPAAHNIYLYRPRDHQAEQPHGNHDLHERKPGLSADNMIQMLLIILHLTILFNIYP
jgi:hypothetical protein